MLVPESGRNSQSAWGPPCGEFISHISSFFFFNSRWLKIKQESRWKHNLLRMVWIVCFWPVSDLFLTSRGWFDSSILIQEKEKGREVLYITLKSWLLAAIQNLNLIWKEIIVSMSGSKPIKPVFLGSVSQHQSKAPIESAGSFLCKSLDTRMAETKGFNHVSDFWCHMDGNAGKIRLEGQRAENGLNCLFLTCFSPVSDLFLIFWGRFLNLEKTKGKWTRTHPEINGKRWHDCSIPWLLQAASCMSSALPSAAQIESTNRERWLLSL